MFQRSAASYKSIRSKAGWTTTMSTQPIQLMTLIWMERPAGRENVDKKLDLETFSVDYGGKLEDWIEMIEDIKELSPYLCLINKVLS